MRKGFTLIEILIVVAIIAILASVVLIGLGPTQQSGRDARRLSDLHEAQNAIELYFQKCGYYPGGVNASSPCGAFSAVSTWANLSTSITGSAIGVTNPLPNDPTSGKTYYYGTNAAGSSYVIAATLENTNNAVFNNYTPMSLTGYTIGISTCALPNYCMSL